MGRRLTRKQIKKKDQFVTFFDRVMDWMSQNWRQAAMGLGGAVLLGVLYWGATAVLASRAGTAALALNKALEIYTAPIADKAPEGAEVWFTSKEARRDAAEEAFSSVSSRFRFTPHARLARLYKARITAERGDLDSAARQLAELARRRSDAPLVRMATTDLFRLRLARGEGKQLVRDLEAMAAGRDPRLPRDTALFFLAQVWEREGDDQEALGFYRRIVEDYPESPYRSAAEQRVSAAS